MHSSNANRTLGAPLILVLVALLGGCTSSMESRFCVDYVAYWAQNTGPTCPLSLEATCFSEDDDVQELAALFAAQESAGMEIDNFDIRAENGSRVFATSWKTGDSGRTFLLGLSWRELVAQHQSHSEVGDRLVRLRVYPQDGAPRVAALWEKAKDGASAERPDRIERRTTWAGFRSLDQTLQRRHGYRLAAMDVFQHHGRNQIAGVWRFGGPDSRIEVGLTCEDDSPQLEVNGQTFADCNLTRALEAKHDEGWRIVDVEPYEIDGQTRFAVLFQDRVSADWLQFPALPRDIRERQTEMHTPDGPPPNLTAFGFELIDFDIIHESLGPERDCTHLGLVHDAGTSGPPPESSP